MQSSGIGKFDRNDLIKSSESAVCAAILVALLSVVQSTSFDVFSTDWSHVLSLTLNGAITAFVGNLARIMLTDNQAKFVGKI